MGKHIQRAGSAIPLVRPVFDLYKDVLNGAHKLLLEAAVHVLKGAKGEHFHIVSVSDGRCFEFGGALCVDKRCSWIGRGHKPYFREGRIDGGGEGESQMSKRASAKVCVDGDHVRLEEIVNCVDH